MLDEVYDLIERSEWVLGAVNYDEDLHFSTYYLRASWAKNTIGLYPGYSCIVSFYEDFVERYYLLAHECASSAAAIIARALRDKAWLPGILTEIERQSDVLSIVFEPALSPTMLSRLSDAEVSWLYERLDVRSRALYRHARLPEALDRGLEYFTNYLTRVLKEGGLSGEEAERAFSVLTQPVEPSILAQELLAFDAIVERTRSDAKAAATAASDSRRARMLLPQDVIGMLQVHLERWKFLEYHGYGRRELTSLDQYVERLGEHVRDSSLNIRISEILARLDRNREAREQLFTSLRMDAAHRALFEVYPEIGAVKLYRRYAQLKNFYYLDMLLADIARRLRCSEWNIRCMLPEEVREHLASGSSVDRTILAREQGLAYVLQGDREYVEVGERASDLKHRLATAVRRPTGQRVLKGVVACRGKIVGTCKIVIRSGGDVDFRQGAILASESTDPDLIKLLKIAGGVLTEQGGVTSHAAIICRELGIPTIIGIEGLPETVRDGDVVEVDADAGVVRMVRTRMAPPDGVVDASAALGGVIGGKAQNLVFLRTLGYAVPEFVVLEWRALRDAMESASKEWWERLATWIGEGLRLKLEDGVIIRSSSIEEDSAESSQAGKYQSIRNVALSKLSEGLRAFVADNGAGRLGRPYQGSLVVQRMIAAQWNGVCLTADQRLGGKETLVVEAAAGSEGLVTDGKVTQRILIDRRTHEIVDTAGGGDMGFDLRKVVTVCLELEERMGRPVDVEWVYDGVEHYIVQVRPIAGIANKQC